MQKEEPEILKFECEARPGQYLRVTSWPDSDELLVSTFVPVQGYIAVSLADEARLLDLLLRRLQVRAAVRPVVQWMPDPIDFDLALEERCVPDEWCGSCLAYKYERGCTCERPDFTQP